MAFRIKICGITEAAQVEGIAAGGADAIGLNFVPTSKRRVTREQAREICAATPAGILKVGVFANAPLSEMVECLEKLPLDLVQLHGAETLDAYQELARAIGAERIVRALPWGASHEAERSAFLSLVRYTGLAPAALLLDSAAGKQFGGTGLSLPWDDLSQWNQRPSDIPLILAGGLKPSNIAEAIAQVRPHGVDVAGGVESSPGIKDLELVKAFCLAARGASERPLT